MKLKLILFITLYYATSVLGQKMDTVKFYSKAFNSERTVYITTPEFYKYQSQDVRLPVIYLLDGQHDWFVNPVQNTIRYLQYTHQIPQAIVVTIPLINRNEECGINNIDGEELPLYKFITVEVEEKIKELRQGDFKILIGHSYSASFSIYSFLKNPTYFSAVIANTPLDSFKDLLLALKDNESIDKGLIFISVGGTAKHEDYFHRHNFDMLKKEFPSFFNSINTFVAENAGHNAVPILATPNLLTKLFSEFSKRYSSIAMVDEEYKIINRPISIEDELKKINDASKLGSNFYPPEIAELNGIASRYWNNSLDEYAIAIYEMGVKYYPQYYGFHLHLYELLLPTNKEGAKKHLHRAYELLNSIETNLSERLDLLNEISNERIKNGWQ